MNGNSPQTADDFITKAHVLVPAPPVLPLLMPLLNNPNADFGKVVDLISYDTALTANLLRVCNSAFYCRGTPIDSLPIAVNRLGSREIYRISVAVTSAVTLCRPQKGYGVQANDLWNHSVATAIAAQIVAKETGLDENVSFTAGLLHDVGKIVLSSAMESIYQKFAQETTNNGLSVLEAEIKLLGVDHAEVGARLLEGWNFPENLVKIVRHHHHPAAATNFEKLAACVCLGNMISYFMGHGYGGHSVSFSGRTESLAILEVDSDRLPQFMQTSFEKIAAVRSLYRLEPSHAPAVEPAPATV